MTALWWLLAVPVALGIDALADEDKRAKLRAIDLDPLMGWAGSADTRAQVRLDFATMEEAVAHAEKNGWTYTVQAAKERRIRPWFGARANSAARRRLTTKGPAATIGRER